MQTPHLWTSLAAFGFLSTFVGIAAGGDDRPNVLFIVADDQNCRLGCYGDAWTKTPNLDRLAARGLTLRRAYCQTALCNPSRASVLSGLRPARNGVVDNGGHLRDHHPDLVTLPQYFKQHGYHTVGLGKIFHPGYDDEPSWSEPHWDPPQPAYGPEGLKVLAELEAEADRKAAAGGKRPKHIIGLPWEVADCADEALTDGGTATKAIETLQRLGDRPFFLAVGFLRPHLPLAAPRKYWDLYPPETVRLTPYPIPPQDAPACALYDWSELRAHVGIPKTGPLSDEQARSMVRAYAASTTYMDAQVGRILDELRRLDLQQKTVVVFWGDHGWQLGEHGFWGKHTNYEDATHAPLIVARGDGVGGDSQSDAFVEFVDIYPTLAELCGLPSPAGLDGRSFAKLFEFPNAPFKQAAYHQYVRRMKDFGEVTGRAVRTDRYRYVEWSLPEKNYLARELYDYANDPGETVNLADKPERAAVVEELRQLLHRQ